MSQVQNFKVAELPDTLLPDTVYYVKRASDARARIYVTTSMGVPVEIDGVNDAEFHFNTPAEEWIVTHNLNRKPDPLILIGGQKVMSDVQYLDNDVFKVIHSKPQTGVVVILG